MQKRIIIVNEMYSDNIGDQAISEAMADFFGVDDSVVITKADFSFRAGPSKTKKNKSIISWKKKIPDFIKFTYFFTKNIKNANFIAREKYHVAIIGGGQLILSNSSFSLSMLLYVVFLKLYGTKIKLVSVGVGEKFSLANAFLYKLAFRFVDDIYLRDAKSIENFRKIFGGSAKYSPDIAYYFSEKKIIQNDIDTYEDLVCPVDYMVYKRYRKEANNPCLSYNEYKLEWLKIIDNMLLESPLNTIIVTATTQADYDFSLDVYNASKVEYGARLRITKSNNMYDFLAVARDCRCVVSGRMHALILCHNIGLKIKPFKISSKIISFENEYLNSTSEYHKKKLEKIRSDII
ncbi:polysaccharide pyruvyl transferase family protein [Marinomonas sp. A79]|uniref:Polysaccharide pyruvyl transferase family protein n=1 Tax=Marinomonas vulgaris TaxID=2823372 RepID=A0ABS5HD51_9GAMM|nr:polysaccharide pyruvyl transferase family protein [Marinomonas vulgaris]MBR7889324.1 polysaccharide pyruvyl transferase family protein [Marinomonas vulgaris]